MNVVVLVTCADLLVLASVRVTEHVPAAPTARAADRSVQLPAAFQLFVPVDRDRTSPASGTAAFGASTDVVHEIAGLDGTGCAALTADASSATTAAATIRGVDHLILEPDPSLPAARFVSTPPLVAHRSGGGAARRVVALEGV